MKNNRNRVDYVLGLLTAVGMLAFGHSTYGQVEGGSANEDEVVSAADVKTLDQVRALGGLQGNISISIPSSGPWQKSMFDVTVGFDQEISPSVVPDAVLMVPHDPRKEALKKVRVLQQKLNSPDEDRAKIEAQLEAALAEYFIADMRHRVSELDEIKAKIAETEAKLQQRLDTHQESVDLQLRIMLREADGFGFFQKEDATSTSDSEIPGLNPLGSAAGYPGAQLTPAGDPATSVLRPRRR